MKNLKILLALLAAFTLIFAVGCPDGTTDPIEEPAENVQYSDWLGYWEVQGNDGETAFTIKIEQKTENKDYLVSGWEGADDYTFSEDEDTANPLPITASFNSSDGSISFAVQILQEVELPDSNDEVDDDYIDADLMVGGPDYDGNFRNDLLAIGNEIATAYILSNNTTANMVGKSEFASMKYLYSFINDINSLQVGSFLLTPVDFPVTLVRTDESTEPSATTRSSKAGLASINPSKTAIDPPQ